MKNKKILFLFVFICIIIFSIFYYIFSESGNNNTRKQNELIENALRKLEYYDANIDVTIKSNKTENKYNMNQIVKPNYSKLIINLPEEISDLEFEIDNNILKISRNSIGLSKCYDEYKVINNNSLFLKSFIEDYMECKNLVVETNDEIIITLDISNNKNTYVKSKKLYLDKTTYLPKKLIVANEEQNIYTSIIYNDIKIK